MVVVQPGRFFGTMAIRGYQKFISPYKGYSCAHKKYTGGDSCSEHVKKHMQENGLIKGIKEYFRRTKECKVVYMENKDNCDCDCDGKCKEKKVHPRIPRDKECSEITIGDTCSCGQYGLFMTIMRGLAGFFGCRGDKKTKNCDSSCCAGIPAPRDKDCDCAGAGCCAGASIDGC